MPPFFVPGRASGGRSSLVARSLTGAHEHVAGQCDLAGWGISRSALHHVYFVRPRFGGHNPADHFGLMLCSVPAASLLCLEPQIYALLCPLLYVSGEACLLPLAPSRPIPTQEIEVALEGLEYLGRDGRDFRFKVNEQHACGGVAESLAALGISKALSGRLRAQKRAVLDSGASILVIAAEADEQPSEGRLEQFCKAFGDPACLYEDDFMLALDKPAGVLVHGDGTGAPTLSDAACGLLARGEGLLAPQAVQRLDVPTTGVVLFSKAVEFQGLFDALVADHSRMTKRYLVAVQGAYPRAHDRIDAPLGRDRHDARKMRVCAPGAGQDACTEVERLAEAPDGSSSLLLVTLRSGRKHQIRAHLAYRGFPIVGDALYGARAASTGPLMLHAWNESFEHPITGQPVSIVSPSIERFERLFPGFGDMLAARVL